MANGRPSALPEVIKALVHDGGVVVTPDDGSRVVGDPAEALAVGQGLFQSIGPCLREAEDQFKILPACQAPPLPRVPIWPPVSFR